MDKQKSNIKREEQSQQKNQMHHILSSHTFSFNILSRLSLIKKLVIIQFISNLRNQVQYELRIKTFYIIV